MTIKEIKKIAHTACYFLNGYNYSVINNHEEQAKKYHAQFDAIAYMLIGIFGYTVEEVRLGTKSIMAGIAITKCGKCLWGSCLAYSEVYDNMCKERMEEYLSETSYSFADTMNIYDD